MIVGVGTDIIEIDRISKACSKEGFKKKCYTEGEMVLINERAEGFAGNFAVRGCGEGIGNRLQRIWGKGY